MRLSCLVLLCIAAGSTAAQMPGSSFAATGTVQYAFTSADYADEMIIAAINAAHLQVLVQAYSFTHRRIADALVRARSRGVEVALIVDHEQSRASPAIVHVILHAGVPVLVDAQHAAAHNKIIVIDAGHADCAVVTGSFNFTYAAQHRNAENVLVMRGNSPLCDAYFNNWRRHQLHAHAMPKSR
ncbi:MAG: phospholipase D family protein [Burkholderiales bacterium]